MTSSKLVNICPCLLECNETFESNLSKEHSDSIRSTNDYSVHTVQGKEKTYTHKSSSTTKLVNATIPTVPSPVVNSSFQPSNITLGTPTPFNTLIGSLMKAQTHPTMHINSSLSQNIIKQTERLNMTNVVFP